ncbi:MULTISPECIES: alanine racemase [unclassified Colwellia]|uniref:alanine racemase n=1 Tax=unclassified Colwellia TaxID=196834 RepID=UPI0015F6D36C|nr:MULTISPECIES: alanine racemase [unclassified Colwellia]MBA6232350.1 alanine racemase [Colwellia sp. MB02u-7]MBA6236026.1 alanine racemase [Colwellia sp. MB02u-11]MBA6256720.1 alanine racemase [Colwellia sp. MB3u-28]MBA6261435.1 alanine racemase [Colwellia sp. MB3u-41]MBA6298569.1 alanine racemase [Colwellia sp. MB3u-22]
MALTTATAIINLSALKYNLAQLKSLAPRSKVLAVLKANAYGHGLERIAHALFSDQGMINEYGDSSMTADAIAVARIDEALALRASGITQPIVLLEGFFNAKDLTILAENNLQTVIHNRQQLDALLLAKLASPLKVWLKIDTGMHRLGINPEEFTHFYQQLLGSENVQENMVLMSHLGCADDKSSKATSEQISLFEKVTMGCDEERTLANSAGIFAWPMSHYQWIRPGLLLYGVSPLPLENTAKGISASALINKHKSCDLQPVMTLKSSLIAIRELAAGESVGYGYAWKSEEKTIIGVVAIGYGDGYPRHAQNGTPVLVNGRRVPLVGRVSMDMITIDLGINSQEQVGDVVTLWGEQLSVAEIAKCATTIPYELLCNITRRVHITLSVQ